MLYVYFMECQKLFIIICCFIVELKGLYSNLIVAMVLIESQTCIRFKETNMSDLTTQHVVIFTLGTERYRDVSVECEVHTTLPLTTTTLCLIINLHVNACNKHNTVLKSVMHVLNIYLHPFSIYCIGEFVLQLVLIAVVSINVCHCIRIMEMSGI